MIGRSCPVGIGTPEFKVGDEVVAYARKDIVQGGTFAELVTMSVRGVAHKSPVLSWDEAGGLPSLDSRRCRRLTV